MVDQLTVDSSSSSESEETNEEDSGHNTDSQLTPSKDSSSGNITFESLFPSMRQVYGMEIEHPKKLDIFMYKRYVWYVTVAYRACRLSVIKPVGKLLLGRPRGRWEDNI
jgi:hypothetical protein